MKKLGLFISLMALSIGVLQAKEWKLVRIGVEEAILLLVKQKQVVQSLGLILILQTHFVMK